MAIATPLNPDQPILPPDTDASEQEGLVEYEGMLVSASAAQRRRSCPHFMLSSHLCKAFVALLSLSWHARGADC